MSRYSALQLICDTGKILFGHVDTITASFSCWHEKLSNIVWTPVYTAPNCGHSGKLSTGSSQVQSFSFSCDVVFSLMVDVTSLFMSLFLTTDLSQTEVFGNFLKYISELSDFRESVRSVNECEYKKKSRKICAKGNDVITDVTCASQHFASTFSMQIF